MLEPHGDAEIQRILGRDAFLHEGHQRFVGRFFEVGNHRALDLGVVVEQIDRAARGGDKADARPLRQPAAGERERSFQEVVEGAAMADAVTFAHREIGRKIATDDAGVGKCRGLRFCGDAGLDRKDRLAGRERAPGGLHERQRAADALDEQHDRAGVRVVDQEIEVVGEIEIGLVARADAVGEAQTAVGAAAQPELQGAARLEDAADRARGEAPKLAVGIGKQPLAIAVRAHAIGAGDA